MTQPNPIGWFEIPVTNMSRAIKFYETIFKFNLSLNDLGDLKMAWFPMENKGYGSTGSLVLNKNYKPSQDGVLIYFTSPSGDINSDLEKIEKAGGKTLQKKKQIGEHGFVGFFIDTEGNRIALHSMK